MKVKVRLQKNGQYTVGAFTSDMMAVAPVCAKIVIDDGVKEYDTYYPHSELSEVCDTAYRRSKGEEKYPYYLFRKNTIGWSDIAGLCFRGLNPDDKGVCISYDTNTGQDGDYRAYIVPVEPERVDFGAYTLIGKVRWWVTVINEQKVCSTFKTTGFDDEISIYQKEHKFILAGRGLEREYV